MSDHLDTHDLSLLATAGDATAQFNLAVRYADGEGVQQSCRHAAYWYARAAHQGHVQGNGNWLVAWKTVKAGRDAIT
ncbi:hypothetical protein FSO04_45390 [Paraburkholderia madseniana]|uniref:Sel1 repeat family protein n=1 Tax=Paraburkholderia madseniana TaxID=2599607 RepID=A0A6N6VXK5_9BURK|nr:SEL1-like repeat protein [Paraburkholderia madseniana]KAE8753402.1 hypothetical protein FSO04_45390 [Paraburkholderia madseniana]